MLHRWGKKVQLQVPTFAAGVGKKMLFSKNIFKITVF